MSIKLYNLLHKYRWLLVMLLIIGFVSVTPMLLNYTGPYFLGQILWCFNVVLLYAAINKAANSEPLEVKE